MSVVVAGGTGRLGSLVVTQLRAAGREVRVLSRGRTPAPEALNSCGAEFVVADVRDPYALRKAVDGATVVVSAVQGFNGRGRVSPGSVDRDGNARLADATAHVNADVVMMSIVGASPTNPMELFRAKHAAEEQLRRTGVPATIVRATAFAELWAEIMKKPIVFGKGDNPINFVSVADVANAVVRAVNDPTSRGRAIEVGGPDDPTFNEFAARLQEARHRSANTKHVPRGMLHVMSRISRRAAAGYAMDTIDMTFRGNASPEAEHVITAPLSESVFAPA